MPPQVETVNGVSAAEVDFKIYSISLLFSRKELYVFIATMLCSRCKEVLDSIPNSRVTFTLVWDGQLYSVKHYDTADELEKSSKLGCHLCTLVWNAFEPRLSIRDGPAHQPDLVVAESGQHSSVQHGSVGVYKRGGVRKGRVPRSDLSYELSFNYTFASRPLRKTVFFVPAEVVFGKGLHTLSASKADLVPPKGTCEQLSGVRAFSTNTKSDESLECALQWFDTCVNSHSRCNKPAWDVGFRPTRLIDLNPLNQSTQPRLCDASELPSTFKYATLSHCWGSIPIVRLTVASMASMRVGLPISDLSETFKNAMFIASRLGVRYLWIDSLCIIQGDFED